jgi:hypothetical protein
MIDSRVRFSIDGVEFSVLNRSPRHWDTRTVDEFARRVLAKTSYAGEWKSPVGFFALEPLTIADETVVSKAWKKMFNQPFLPYSLVDRNLTLVSDD